MIKWETKIPEIDSAIAKGDIPLMVKLWRELDAEGILYEDIPGEEAGAHRAKIADNKAKLSIRIIRLLPL